MSHFTFGRSPRPSASPAACQSLEARLLFSTLVVSGTTGEVSIGASAAGSVTVTIGSKTTTYAKGQWDSVEVTAPENVNVAQTVVPTTIEAVGSSRVTAGDSSGVQHIQAPLLVEAMVADATAPPAINLRIDDTGDSTNRAATLDVSNGTGRVIGLAPAEIYYRSVPGASGSIKPIATNSLNLVNVGTVNLLGSLPSFSMWMLGPSAGTLTVGIGNSSTPPNVALVSPLRLSAQSVVLDDSADSASRTITIGAPPIQNLPSYQSIDGIGALFRGITFSVNPFVTNAFTLKAGSGANTFLIEHAGPVQIIGGAADDTFVVANSSATIDGGGGHNRLIAESSIYYISAGQIHFNLGEATDVTRYSNIQALTLSDAYATTSLNGDLGPIDLTLLEGGYRVLSDQHVSSLTVGANTFVTLGYHDALFTNALNFLADPANGIMTPNGVLDVATGAVRLDYGSGPDPLPGYVSAGRVISSQAGGAFSLGVADRADGPAAGLPAHTAIARLAAIGDPDMDQQVAADAPPVVYVGFKDLIILAAHYGQKNALWDQGDFNGDGVVGFDDLVLLAQNYRKPLQLPGA